MLWSLDAKIRKNSANNTNHTNIITILERSNHPIIGALRMKDITNHQEAIHEDGHYMGNENDHLRTIIGGGRGHN